MIMNPKTPMALYKANLELVLRIGALLQENRQRWMQAGAAGTSDAIQRTLAETERVLTTNDWPSLSAMPGEEFWKSLRGGAGPLQGTFESAVRSQAEFAEGLKQAFAEWQQQSAEAVGGNAAKAVAWTFPDLQQAFNASARTESAAPGQEASETKRPATKAKAPTGPSKSTAARAKGKAKGKAKAAPAKASRAAKPRKKAKK